MKEKWRDRQRKREELVKYVHFSGLWIRKIKNFLEKLICSYLSLNLQLFQLDDRTLINYKDMLRKQLQKLERFREVSFGPHSVAKHPPALQTSWFFRRRSLPSISPRQQQPPSAPHTAAQVPLIKHLRLGFGEKRCSDNFFLFFLKVGKVVV